MIKNYGLAGKDENIFVQKYIENIFGDIPDEDLTLLNICGIQPYTRRKREIDLLSIFHLKRESSKRQFRFIDKGEKLRRTKIASTGVIENRDIPANHQIYLETIACSIEIKAHHGNDVQINGDDLYVMYDGKPSIVTSKLIEQAKSAKMFLDNQLGVKIHNIVSLVYLPNIKKSELLPQLGLKNLRHCLLFSDSTFGDLLENVLYGQGVFGFSDSNYSVLGDNKFNMSLCLDEVDRYYRDLRPGFLEQEKLEIISKRLVDKNKEWVQSLGKKMIAFTGVAGTGKTLKLIRTCNDLLNEYMDPVLFITFNRALARDLERLMQLQRLNTGGRITVWTIDSFLFKLAHRFRLYEDFSKFVEENKANRYMVVRDLIREQIKVPDILRQIQHDLFREFTYVAIDEAQDWFESERDIILDIFGPEKVILAAGADQCLRAPNIANWKGDAKRRNCDIYTIPSNISLRLTSNLSHFSNALADALELDWKVKPNDELLGGDIYLFDKISIDVMEIFLKEIKEQKPKYAPIDFLVLAAAKSEHLPFEILKGMSLDYWDGIGKTDRDIIPGINQIRCVSLESCRGLEGWATLILDLDKWYWFCMNRNRSLLENKTDVSIFEFDYLSRKPTQDDYHYLPSWFLIPFTRAKNRMLIQLPSSAVVRNALLDLKNEFPTFVHIIE